MYTHSRARIVSEDPSPRRYKSLSTLRLEQGLVKPRNHCCQLNSQSKDTARGTEIFGNEQGSRLRLLPGDATLSDRDGRYIQ